MGYWIVRAVLTPILRLLFRPKIMGLENLPAEGAAILAGNHVSYMDWLFLPMICDRKITYLAKSDYFTGTGFKGAVQRAFFTSTGQVPIDRSGASASQRALDTGKRVLGEGNLMGIFPEGTRSPDGRLYRGKTGVARMALEAGVPVIPCAGIGIFEVAPPDRRLPKLRGGRVTIKIGAPLDFSRYEGMESDPFVLRSITDEIMYELMDLTGQEYVDAYASRGRKKAPSAADATNGSGEARPVQAAS